MIKRLLIALVLILASAALIFYVVVESRWFPAVALNIWFRFKQPQLRIQHLTYDSRRTSFQVIEFENLNIDLKRADVIWNLRLDHLQLRTDQNFFSPKRIMQLKLSGPEISNGELTLEQPALDLFLKKVERTEALDGKWSVRSLVWGNYQIQNLSSLIGGTSTALSLNHFSAEGFGGKISGEILLEFLSMLSYDIHLDLDDIDLRQMQQVNETIFSQFSGRMSGSVRIAAAGNAIQNFSADFELGEGSQVRAQFLSLFTPYVPEMQRGILETAIAKNENLPIHKAILKLKNVGQDRLSFNVDLDSSVINLDDSSVDINLDAPIMNLFHLLDILKQIKSL